MLLTKQDIKNLPELYSTEDVKEPVVFVKLFHPLSSATWLLTEYNPEEKLAFGYCHITDGELGYVSIAELENIVIGGLKVEKDRSWKPKKLSEAKKELGL